MQIQIVTLALAPLAAAPQRPSQDGWTDLDREIAEIAELTALADLDQPRVVPRVGAYVSSAALRAEGDLPDALDGGFSTVDLFGAELWVEHETAAYQWRVSADFADLPGTELLQDAWVGTTLVDVLDVRLGRQKPPLAISSMLDPEATVFFERSLIGQGFDFWDEGLTLTHQYPGVTTFLGLTNGVTGENENHLMFTRFQFDHGLAFQNRVWGKPWITPSESAIRSSTAVVWGVTAAIDDGEQDGEMFVLDGISRFGWLRAGFEVVRYAEAVDEGYRTARRAALGNFGFALEADTTPASLWLSADLTSGESSGTRLGLRAQDPDYDDIDVQIYTLELAVRVREGVEWIFGGDYADSDLDALDGGVLRVGLKLGGARGR